MRNQLRRLVALQRRHLNRAHIARWWSFLRAHRRKAIHYSVIGALILASAAVLVAKLSGERYADGLQATRTSLQRLQDNLGDIMEPAEIELGQQDLSVDHLLEQTDPKTKPLPTITRPPAAPMIFVHLLPNANYPYAALRQGARVRSDAAKLLSYQHRTFLALQPVLEYNPRAEFADKTLNDDEINLRITNAWDGLRRAHEQLSEVKARPDDGTRDQLLDTIASLQQSLETFGKNRAYDAWAKQVEHAQKEIIANRQTYWGTATSTLYERLSTVNSNLATIEHALRR